MLIPFQNNTNHLPLSSNFSFDLSNPPKWTPGFPGACQILQSFSDQYDGNQSLTQRSIVRINDFKSSLQELCAVEMEIQSLMKPDSSKEIKERMIQWNQHLKGLETHLHSLSLSH